MKWYLIIAALIDSMILVLFTATQYLINDQVIITFGDKDIFYTNNMASFIFILFAISTIIIFPLKNSGATIGKKVMKIKLKKKENIIKSIFTNLTTYLSIGVLIIYIFETPNIDFNSFGILTFVGCTYFVLEVLDIGILSIIANNYIEEDYE